MFGLSGIVGAFRDLFASIRTLTATFHELNAGIRGGLSMDALPAPSTLPPALVERTEAAPPEAPAAYLDELATAHEEAAPNGEPTPTPRRKRSS